MFTAPSHQSTLQCCLFGCPPACITRINIKDNKKQNYNRQGNKFKPSAFIFLENHQVLFFGGHSDASALLMPVSLSVFCLFLLHCAATTNEIHEDVPSFGSAAKAPGAQRLHQVVIQCRKMFICLLAVSSLQRERRCPNCFCTRLMIHTLIAL